MISHAHRWPVLLLLLLGLLLWLFPGGAIADWNEQLPPLILPLAALLCLTIPPFRRLFHRILVRLDAKFVTATQAVVVALLAGVYLTFTAFRQHRYLGPAWHDEFSYLLQTQMIARGRFWMPPHPLADFFDSFYIITDPVYASMYFPGASLLYSPVVWLGLPKWLLPILFAAAIVGCTYWLIGRLLNPASGIAAALLMVSIQQFRMVSTMLMSHLPVLLLGLLATIAYFHWRQSRRTSLALAIGALAGWMAITRPLDALCFCIPLALCIALDLYPLRSAWLPTAAAFIFPALPFLALQGVINHNVTGHWAKYPWQHYVDRDFPRTGLGFNSDGPSTQPISPIAQKQAFYSLHGRGLLTEHRIDDLPSIWLRKRLPITLKATLPLTVLCILLPVGFLAWNARPRMAMAAVLPSFILLYSLSVFFLSYYPIIVAPAVLLTVLAGIEFVAATWPNHQSTLRLCILTAIAAAAIATLPELNLRSRDEPFHPKTLALIEQWEASIPNQRAILLCRWQTRRIDEEPVYNSTVPWPDDARIIRAHDLGPRNIELFAYYAARQPDRDVYLHDDADDSIRLLGNVQDLAHNRPPGL